MEKTLGEMCWKYNIALAAESFLRRSLEAIFGILKTGFKYINAC